MNDIIKKILQITSFVCVLLIISVILTFISNKDLHEISKQIIFPPKNVIYLKSFGHVITNHYYIGIYMYEGNIFPLSPKVKWQAEVVNILDKKETLKKFRQKEFTNITIPKMQNIKNELLFSGYTNVIILEKPLVKVEL